MSLLDHAVMELDALGVLEYDNSPEPGGENTPGPDTWMRDSILELLTVLSKQGHSGESRNLCIGLFTKLAQFQPLTPITGRDTEWFEHENPIMFQNKRLGNLFKAGARDQAYYLDAVHWRTQTGRVFAGPAKLPDGSTLLSRQYVKTFPFTPKTFAIDVIEEEIAPDDWEFTVKDVAQLDEVWAYYDRFDPVTLAPRTPASPLPADEPPTAESAPSE